MITKDNEGNVYYDPEHDWDDLSNIWDNFDNKNKEKRLKEIDNWIASLPLKQ